MKAIACVFSILILFQTSLASVNKDFAANNSALEVLKMPAAVRAESLKHLGAKGYKHLREIAFDSNYGMKFQWRALSALSLLAGDKSAPELELAMKQKEWYLRNAGLVMLKEVKPKRALVWAKKLMKDSSLIVRTAAVEVIRSLKDNASTHLLWSELYEKQNYRGQQSLWIRRHIVEALGEMGKPGDVAQFMKVLDDKDATLYLPAVSALERLTKKQFGGPKDSLEKRVSLCKSWWKEQT